MSFVTPWVLAVAALLLVLAALWYLGAERRRKRGGEAFGSGPVMASVVPAKAGARRHLGPLLLIVALGVLLVAAARPQVERTVKVERASVMLVIDRSGSMSATDVGGGTRMAAAHDAGDAFLRAAPREVRVGLIGFNGDVQLLESPTTDRRRVQLQLRGLDPAGSTAAGDALDRALRTLRPKGQATADRVPAAIILLSDGESVRGEDPLAVARRAQQADVAVTTIALGTDDGVLETTQPDGSVKTEPVPPDRETLRAIAELTGGEAYDAPDAASLQRVYEELGSKSGEREELVEITAWFAAAALALLAAGVGASLTLTGRVI